MVLLLPVSQLEQCGAEVLVFKNFHSIICCLWLVTCIWYCIFIGWQNYSLLFCLVVALDIKMCEIDGNSPLWWGNDLPDTILVAWVNIWEGGTRDCTISRVNDSSTCILTSALIGVKFITDSAWTGITSKSIDAFVFTSMIGSMTFIILLNWKSWPNQIWNWETGLNSCFPLDI